MIALYEKGGKIIGSNPRYYIRFANNIRCPLVLFA